jgi:excisionase family DNA binding protein
MTAMRDYCDVDEAAERLKVHPESVRRLLREGKLKASKIAGRWMLHRAYVEQYARGYDPRPGNGPQRIEPEISGECPACGLGNTSGAPLLITDAAGRRWHLSCAEAALAAYLADQAGED